MRGRHGVNELRIFNAADPEWDAWIGSTAHDIYHTAAYHRVTSFEGDGTPLLMVYGSPDQFVAWPYLLKPIPDTSHTIGSPAFDVTSSYGYCGPLAHGCEPDDAFIVKAWGAFKSAWLEQHVVSVFARFHPLLQNHCWFMDAVAPDGGEPQLGMVHTGDTVSIDLRKPAAQILAEYPRVLRQEIASSRRKGLVTTIDRDWEHLETFEALYTETMRRNQAQKAYFLPRDYFADLVAQLGKDAVLFVTMHETDVAAACLFFSHHGYLHPHLAGISTPFLPMSPLKVMWDDVRIWAAKRGDSVMHLGGGRGGASDSLLAFKARFSPDRQPFYTGRWILDRRRYEWLARESPTDETIDTSYFPIYRAPRSLE